jgi:hypothetical protein
MFPSRRALLICFVTALLLQTAATIGAIVFFGLPISTEIDSVEYINTADNVLARGSFSIEEAPPFRPNGFRTPGPLILNIPLRILSLKNDMAAALITRLVLFLAAILCVLNASQLGLKSYALLAGPLFVLTPTMFYYSMLPYSTELPYSVACNLLQLGTFLYLGKARTLGGVLIGFSALYALLLRPAALFVLIAYVGSCALGALVTRDALRRRIVIAGGVCLLGACIAYATWCYRNYVVFHAFQYSTVSADNLLKWNARGMEPFLDGQGRQELRESLGKYPLALQRYSGPDQFVLARQESDEGLRLMRKYPVAFLKSHLRGAVESALIFRPASLGPRLGVLVVAMSAAHLGYLVLGMFGLLLLYRTLNHAQRAALLIIAVAGAISILSGGSTHSPRFRIPLDILLVVGTVNSIVWVRSRRPEMSSVCVGQ